MEADYTAIETRSPATDQGSMTSELGVPTAPAWTTRREGDDLGRHLPRARRIDDVLTDRRPLVTR
jgi:hypothetical protein